MWSAGGGGLEGQRSPPAEHPFSRLHCSPIAHLNSPARLHPIPPDLTPLQPPPLPFFPQATPWLGVDLGQEFEVSRVTVRRAPVGAANYPAYNSSSLFTVRVGDVAPVRNAANPDGGLDRR